MIGKKVSHYNILEKIGEGGMGEVYLAEDTKLKRKVALKFLPKGFTKIGANGDSPKERFFREARAAAALNHPNIITIHEINEHEDQIYIAMEYVEGKTLKESLTSEPLPLTKVVDYTIQICEGLSKAHEAGIVHRDIKPQNIIINKAGQVKILDFGLAKLKGVSQLTKESSTLGTVHYMSPEQTMGKTVDHRTDIWSLGVVLYEMLTGKLPFKGEYDQAVIYSILNEEPKPLTELQPETPTELWQLIEKSLSKEPDKRFKNVDTLLQRLKTIKDRTVSEKNTPLRNSARKTSKLLLPTMIIAVILAILIGGYFLFKGKPSTSEPILKTITQSPWKNSIAVLPFADMSPKKDQEYFCDGMTEDIITKLTHIQELKVISRTSVMRYKNTKKDIKDIGRELGVATILEGSIRKEADNIRVSAQLINITDGFHLWTDTFNRKLESVFEVQDEVSKAIAQALKFKFTPNQFQLAHPDTVEAYEYQQRTRHWVDIYLLTHREEDFNKILELSKKAIEFSPNNALIYSSLAWAYNTRYSLTREPEYQKLAVENCKKAYQLKPDLAETNASIAFVYHLQGLHEKTAYHLKKALEINDNMSEINHLTGYMFYVVGLYHKALGYFHKAEELNPLYLYTPRMLAHTYMNIGDLTNAEVYSKKSISLAPEDIDELCSYSELLIKRKKLSEAESLLKTASEIKPQYPFMYAVKAYLLAYRGEKEEALTLPIENKWYQGQLYALLGMKDEAFKLISGGSEKSYIRLKKNPFYKNLRGDERYKKILDALRKEYKKFLVIFKDF